MLCAVNQCSRKTCFFVLFAFKMLMYFFLGFTDVANFIFCSPCPASNNEGKKVRLKRFFSVSCCCHWNWKKYVPRIFDILHIHHKSQKQKRRAQRKKHILTLFEEEREKESDGVFKKRDYVCLCACVRVRKCVFVFVKVCACLCVSM